MALILDSGVLVATLDRRDRHHQSCRRLIVEASEPLVIPGPVLPEVDFVVSERAGPGPFLALLRDIVDGSYEVVDPSGDDYVRAAHLMDSYDDLGVGFVDAAILALCERLGEPKVATLDHRHFGVMRPRHVDALELVP